MRNTTLPTNFRQMPKTYNELVAILLPQDIHDDYGLADANEVIERLAGYNLSADQRRYLNELVDVVAAYETVRFPIDESLTAPLDMLKFLLEENGMTDADLGQLLGDPALGAEILAGRQTLSEAHAKKLAERFKVKPGLFLS